MTDVALPPRYTDLGVIGRGGMGEVRRVRDGLLLSTVAMKICTVAFQPDLRRRFVHEARLTAQLHHPAIIAVHDLGELPDGRPYFTMEEVRGRSLEAMVDGLYGVHSPLAPTLDVGQGGDAVGTPRPPPEADLRRVLDVYLRVVRAVAYAHQLDVIHRDLKPENVMVGDYGEVRVMDWGLARRLADSDPTGTFAPGPTDGTGTLAGQVLGTPAFMSPEQARGHHDEVGPASDIYALGAVLYVVLSGRRPYPGRGMEAWKALLDGPPRPLDRALAPAALCELAERAMARDQWDRPLSADVLGDEVAAWIERARRRREALDVVARADARLPEVTRLREAAEAAATAAADALSAVQPYEPVDAKLPGWRLEEESRARAREARLLELDVVQQLRGALNLDPELPEAHDRLAELYKAKLVDAERRRDAVIADEMEVLLRAHDRGAHTRWLQGDGALTLITDPPAEAELFRYVEVDRRLVPQWARSLGPTPLVEVPIGRGSWLVELRRPGQAPVKYPVLIERGEHWDGVAPGDDRPTVIPLPDGLGDEDCYVPAGWCWTGGDPNATDPLPLRRWWIDGFVVRKHPVTNAEFLCFLNDLVAQGDLEGARDVAPAESQAGDGRGPLLYAQDEAGRYRGGMDRFGRSWGEDEPVVLVSWESAAAFARWAASRAGLGWRLVHDAEWEKAARGVDRRLQPWGDHLDATWANLSGSRPGPPAWTPCTQYPTDESPYGVRGMAGNVRDWCGNGYRRGGAPAGLQRVDPASTPAEFYLVRGGAWLSAPGTNRVASRFANRPKERLSSVGFRIGRSVPAADQRSVSVTE